MIGVLIGSKIYGRIHRGGGGGWFYGGNLPGRGGGSSPRGKFSGHRIDTRFSSLVLIEQSIYKMKKIKHGEGN